MIWQHCGRLGDHQEHTFIARQAVVVEVCECDEPRCICDTDSPFPRLRKQEKLRCPGKQVRSVEIPVTTEVKT